MRTLPASLIQLSISLALLGAANCAFSQPEAIEAPEDACLAAVQALAADADRTCSDQIARLRYDAASTGNAPALAGALNNRAIARMQNGDLEGAAADLTEATALEPAAWAPYLNRANLALRTGDPAAALNDLGRLREMLPANSPAALAAARNAALAWRMLGNLNAAAAQLNGADPAPLAPETPPG
jgi:tetratricopeptide (TPR) repeat protein